VHRKDHRGRPAVEFSSVVDALRCATEVQNGMAKRKHVFYAEIGDVLLTGDGLLSAEISPDQLHFTARGYALLASRLEPELDRLLSAEH
jgi:lysophospholipase L1-like esterase